MPHQEKLTVAIQGPSGKTTRGKVLHQSWSSKERTLRAFKALGIAWVLALGAVLIPILHFILVPILLLSGPLAFAWVSQQHELIAGGDGKCPECAETFMIARTAVKWPISDLCNKCQAGLKIRLPA